MGSINFFAPGGFSRGLEIRYASLLCLVVPLVYYEILLGNGFGDGKLWILLSDGY
jgi:hypothetical protein